MKTARPATVRNNSFNSVAYAFKLSLKSLAVYLCITSILPAATVRYNAASGDWTASTWTGGVGTSPPASGDTAHIGDTVGSTIAAVDITTDLSASNFPLIIVGNQAGSDGTLDLEVGGNLNVGTLRIANNGTGVFNHNGGTLTATIIDIASAGGDGTLALNGNNVSVTTFNFGGTSAGSTASIVRGGGNISVSGQLTVEGSLNTWAIDSGDTLGTKILANQGGSLDLNGAAVTIPNLQIGGTTPGSLLRTGGGTFNATSLFDLAGGSSASTAAGDSAGSVTTRQASALTLGADLSISGTFNLKEASTLVMTGFDLTAGTFTYDGAGNTITRGGSDNINATTLNVTNGATFTPDMTGPDLDTVATLLHVHTAGTLDIGSDTLSIPTAELRLGQSSGSAGSLSRAVGGAIAVKNLFVQGASTLDILAVDSITTTITSGTGGTINQKADVTTTLGGSVVLTSAAFGGATYNTDPGTTLSTNSITVGANNAFDNSVFNLGTAAGTASLSGSTGGGTLSVQESGELNGWGTPTMTGTLTGIGRIVANGFGTGASDLDLSSFSSFSAGGVARDNAVGEDHGLYAIDKGRLIMPNVSVGTGSGVIARVGDSISTTDTNDIDMINSAQFDFDSVISAGSISAQLLAVDHNDVEPELIDPLAVWDFSAEDGLAFTTVDLQIRYDDLLAGLEGIDENTLKILHFVGDDWTDITTAINTTDKIISADGITSFSQFAIATGFVGPVPEPSSLVLLGAGAFGLLHSARRKRRANASRSAS